MVSGYCIEQHSYHCRKFCWTVLGWGVENQLGVQFTPFEKLKTPWSKSYTATTNIRKLALNVCFTRSRLCLYTFVTWTPWRSSSNSAWEMEVSPGKESLWAWRLSKGRGYSELSKNLSHRCVTLNCMNLQFSSTTRQPWYCHRCNKSSHLSARNEGVLPPLLIWCDMIVCALSRWGLVVHLLNIVFSPH